LFGQNEVNRARSDIEISGFDYEDPNTGSNRIESLKDTSLEELKMNNG